MKNQPASRIACLLLPLGLMACAVEADDAVDDTDQDSDSADVEAAEYCVQSPDYVPPLSEPLWNLNNHQLKNVYPSDYGTGSCAAYTIGLHNIEYLEVTATNLPTNATDCGNSLLTVRKYRKGVDSYLYVGSRSVHGSWSGGTCHLSTTYEEHDPSNYLRYSVGHEKTVCSGMFCGVYTGRPLSLTARGYDP